MTQTTKAALAAELGISKARVSQYVAAGLPVLADGRLDREQAVKWIADNHADRLNDRHRGVKRAAAAAERVVKTKRPRATPSDPDPCMLIVGALISHVGEIAARAAVEAGAEMKVAYALNAMVNLGLWIEADRLFGIPRHARSPLEDVVTDIDPDWAALADQAGETVDLDAWDAFSGSLPWFKPD